MASQGNANNQSDLENQINPLRNMQEFSTVLDQTNSGSADIHSDGCLEESKVVEARVDVKAVRHRSGPMDVNVGISEEDRKVFGYLPNPEEPVENVHDRTCRLKEHYRVESSSMFVKQADRVRVCQEQPTFDRMSKQVKEAYERRCQNPLIDYSAYRKNQALNHNLKSKALTGRQATGPGGITGTAGGDPERPGHLGSDRGPKHCLTNRKDKSSTPKTNLTYASSLRGGRPLNGDPDLIHICTVRVEAPCRGDTRASSTDLLTSQESTSAAKKSKKLSKRVPAKPAPGPKYANIARINSSAAERVGSKKMLSVSKEIVKLGTSDLRKSSSKPKTQSIVKPYPPSTLEHGVLGSRRQDSGAAESASKISSPSKPSKVASLSEKESSKTASTVRQTKIDKSSIEISYSEEGMNRRLKEYESMNQRIKELNFTRSSRKGEYERKSLSEKEQASGICRGSASSRSLESVSRALVKSIEDKKTIRDKSKKETKESRSVNEAETETVNLETSTWFAGESTNGKIRDKQSSSKTLTMSRMTEENSSTVEDTNAPFDQSSSTLENEKSSVESLYKLAEEQKLSVESLYKLAEEQKSSAESLYKLPDGRRSRRSKSTSIFKGCRSSDSSGRSHSSYSRYRDTYESESKRSTVEPESGRSRKTGSRGSRSYVSSSMESRRSRSRSSYRSRSSRSRLSIEEIEALEEECEEVKQQNGSLRAELHRTRKILEKEQREKDMVAEDLERYGNVVKSKMARAQSDFNQYKNLCGKELEDKSLEVKILKEKIEKEQDEKDMAAQDYARKLNSYEETMKEHMDKTRVSLDQYEDLCEEIEDKSLEVKRLKKKNADLEKKQTKVAYKEKILKFKEQRARKLEAKDREIEKLKRERLMHGEVADHRGPGIGTKADQENVQFSPPVPMPPTPSHHSVNDDSKEKGESSKRSVQESGSQLEQVVDAVSKIVSMKVGTGKNRKCLKYIINQSPPPKFDWSNPNGTPLALILNRDVENRIKGNDFNGEEIKYLIMKVFDNRIGVEDEIEHMILSKMKVNFEDKNSRKEFYQRLIVNHGGQACYKAMPMGHKEQLNDFFLKVLTSVQMDRTFSKFGIAEQKNQAIEKILEPGMIRDAMLRDTLIDEIDRQGVKEDLEDNIDVDLLSFMFKIQRRTDRKKVSGSSHKAVLMVNQNSPNHNFQAEEPKARAVDVLKGQGSSGYSQQQNQSYQQKPESGYSGAVKTGYTKEIVQTSGSQGGYREPQVGSSEKSIGSVPKTNKFKNQGKGKPPKMDKKIPDFKTGYVEGRSIEQALNDLEDQRKHKSEGSKNY